MSAVIKPATTLRGSSLGFIETIGQSLANISPTFTPALNVVAVAALAGQGSWLVYGVASFALLFVGLNIAALAGRFAAAGSFFVFISKSLGPLSGGLAGFGLVAAYIGTAMAVLAGEAIFVQNALTPLGLTVHSYIIYVVTIALVGYLSYRDIKLSSRISVAIEIISVAIISVVLVIAWAKHPQLIVDTTQLTLHGVTPKGFAEAIVLGIFSFVGFESAATLGKESKNPLKTIPMAILSSMIFAGIFFMFVAYTMVIAFGGDASKLGNDSAPLDTLLHVVGQSDLVVFIYVVASMSAFACVLASLNAASRLLFSMGRYQFVHRSMGMVHASHQTPHIAILISSVIALVVPLSMLSEGPLNTFGITGTFATFGFIFAYLLISLAAPIYLYKNNALKARNIVFGFLGGIFMVGAFFGSIYPVPSYPYNVLPYLFLAYLGIGVAWLYMLKIRAPQVLIKMGQDLESQESEVFGRK
ncbi:MAG: APC family permease [Acidithiobacillus sp.]